MKIAICDDEKRYAHEIEEQILKFNGSSAFEIDEEHHEYVLKILR